MRANSDFGECHAQTHFHGEPAIRRTRRPCRGAAGKSATAARSGAARPGTRSRQCLGGETGPGDEGLRLGESELVMSANIDDKFYGQFTAALTPENETEIEEAFFETFALGGGFTVRAGRFLSAIGYLNPAHAHAWDFADQPSFYRAMLGNQY